MSRRRYPNWFDRITLGFTEIVGVVWSNAIYVLTLPFYSLVRLWYGMRHGGGPRRPTAAGMFAQFFDSLLMIPRWTWYYVTLLAASAWYAILQWPRVMRLRDLAAGLPALGAAVGAFVVLFILNKSDVETMNIYVKQWEKSVKSFDAATDDAARAKAIEDALFYSRAVAKLQPTNTFFRLQTARAYLLRNEPRERQRGLSIYNALASEGNADAQYMLGEMQMGSLRSDADYQNAERLLTTAKRGLEGPQAYRLLGMLYYDWFSRCYQVAPTAQLSYMLKPGVQANQLRPTAQKMLENSAENFLQADLSDPEVAMQLAEVYTLLGLQLPSQKVYNDLIVVLNERLAQQESVETRILVARIHKRLQRFAEADEVLRQGANLAADPRYDDERCSVFLMQLAYFRKAPQRDLISEQGILKEAYMADPTDHQMFNEYFLSLCSPTPEESNLARTVLRNITAGGEKTTTAAFLLLFDGRFRTSRVDAEKYLAQLRQMPDPNIAGAVALVADNAVKNGLPKNAPQAAVELFQTALLVWPDHPDLLFLQGRHRFKHGDFAPAVQSFTKVLERRAADGTLQLQIAEEWRVHSALSDSYGKVGRTDKRDEHKRLMEAAKEREAAAKQKL